MKLGRHWFRSLLTIACSVFSDCTPKSIWVRSRNCGCLVTWFCYQLITKPDNKTVTFLWPDPYFNKFRIKLKKYIPRKRDLICRLQNAHHRSGLSVLCDNTTRITYFKIKRKQTKHCIYVIYYVYNNTPHRTHFDHGKTSWNEHLIYVSCW